MSANGDIPQPQKLHAETLWLEDIVLFDFKKQGDGTVILLYTVASGRRYAIPLQGVALDATRKAVSPIAIAGPDQIPRRQP